MLGMQHARWSLDGEAAASGSTPRKRVEETKGINGGAYVEEREGMDGPDDCRLLSRLLI